MEEDILLIKIGGGLKINIDNISQDIALLLHQGRKVILVHGASVIRDEIAKQLGHPTKILTSPSGVSSVYTDEKARDIFLMAYAGLVNKKIVATLQKHGVNAVGLSGIDGKLWQAKKKTTIYAVEQGKTKLINDNLTGKVEKVNADLLRLLMENSYVPVVCPPAISYDNEIINTDNDFATAVMTRALGVTEMVVLFEEAGLLKDFNDKKSLISNIKKDELDQYLQYAQGRMKKKLMGSVKAFENGIKKIYWGDGRISSPIQKALEGKGTIIE